MRTRSIAGAALALLLGVGGVAITAGPASAHDKAADITCTAATISLTNYDAAATAKITLDGEVKHDGTFDGRLVTSYPVSGNIEHTLTVSVRSTDGAQYNLDFAKTTKGCYIAPAIKEIPYPKLLANQVCGPNNDTVYTDPEWLAAYGQFVDGPWIDGNYKANGTVDGSANIKGNYRAAYIWAGTGNTSASDFTRWRMYPGTSPFVHTDLALTYQNTDPTLPCYSAPVPPTSTSTEWVDGEFDCDDTEYTQTRSTTLTPQLFDTSTGLYTPGTAVTTIETRTIEREADCPVVIDPPVDPPVNVDPPVVDPPAVTPPVTLTTAPTPVVPVAQKLAHTGVDDLRFAGMLYGGGILLALGTLFWGLRNRKLHHMK